MPSSYLCLGILPGFQWRTKGSAKATNSKCCFKHQEDSSRSRDTTDNMHRKRKSQLCYFWSTALCAGAESICKKDVHAIGGVTSLLPVTKEQRGVEIPGSWCLQQQLLEVSGFWVHMFSKDDTLLEDVQQSSLPHVRLADGSHGKVTCKGKLTFSSLGYTFANVLCVPSLESNLLSVNTGRVWGIILP